MAIVSYDLETKIRSAINDKLRDTDDDGIDDDSRSLYSSTEIEEFIMRHIETDATSYVYNKIADGYYKYDIESGKCHWNMDFTEELTVDYEAHTDGYIKVTSGTDSRSSITVTAIAVDYGNILYDIFMHLANHKCQQINVTFRDGQYEGYDKTYYTLVKHAHMCRGAFGV